VTDESTMTVNAESGGLCWVSQVTPADTRAIEAGLHELWRLAEAGEVGGALVRAASMTLIVPVQDQAAADDLTETLDELAATHPCRFIVVLLDDTAAEPYARLASHSRRPGEGEAARYWEEIRLVSPRKAIHQVMSAVSTLVLPGLPVQTWWPGEPSFDDDLYNHIVEISDRIILDSSGFAEPTRTLPLLSASVGSTHETIAFADLSWTRLNPWRLLAAEFFDAPADQDLLDSLQRVRVEFAIAAGGESAQALLFIGWLASRLGWEARRRNPAGAGGELVDGVRPVQVEIARAPGGARRDGQQTTEPGLRSVLIEAAEDERHATYSIERYRDDEARTAKVDGARLESLARLPSQDELVLLREELGGFATDRIYQESLALVASLFGGETR
jgi:glucose-6-phosphate dehydrogenase assembly protein OpcA